MKCRTCGAELQPGRLAQRRHVFERIDLHFDYQSTMHFLPADGSDEIGLDRFEKSLALYSVACELLVLDLRSEGPDIRTVPDDQSEEAPCMSCQATIPAGTDTCPKCGWSYNAKETDTT